MSASRVIYLLDNNVLSELWKEKPDPNVRVRFFSSDWFLPVPVIAEIQEGTEASPSAARRIEVFRKLDASCMQPWCRSCLEKSA